MGVVLIPKCVEIHRLSTIQPALLPAACASLAALCDAGRVVGHGHQQALPAGAQRVADGADALAKRASAIGSSPLLSGIDVSVLVVEGLAVGVEVNLHRSH